MENDVPAKALEEYLRFAAETAREAGKISLEYFGKDIQIDQKADLTPVTRADRETEEFLVKTITEKYPEDSVLGEEFGERRGSSPFTWILDPIDGTKSFIAAVPLYSLLIGLRIGDQSVLGVIHIPSSGETVAAAKGMGAYLNGRPCRVSACSSLSEARLNTTDVADFSRRHPAIAERIFSRTGACNTWGDAYGYFLVATGRADAMLDPVLKIWDVAPLKPIIEEAGGVFTDFSGKALSFPQSAVAAPASVHRDILEIIQKHG